eukprot:CAMPEP_0173304624 /NCGR_PEP_ID=MMETSP1143-20121109/19544_1 /TAXON_ID=483371 /ORGANISM="non described non described, Strain CCMP2298" /LENGTH=68 /DNA_ID=CAMNT_0014245457 /DNA_START=275 /DNA_END=477 /DNA_ORIENTATION=-
MASSTAAAPPRLCPTMVMRVQPICTSRSSASPTPHISSIAWALRSMPPCTLPFTGWGGFEDLAGLAGP